MHLLQDSGVGAYRANTTGVPAYLKEHLVERVPSRQTRSAAGSTKATVLMCEFNFVASV